MSGERGAWTLLKKEIVEYCEEYKVKKRKQSVDVSRAGHTNK